MKYLTKPKTKTFRFGEVTWWILKNDGWTINWPHAAFINKKYKNKGDEVPVGGIGFYVIVLMTRLLLILLFDTAREWLQQKGMEAMDGPINLENVTAGGD
jgi:hypothetical protein